MGGPEDGKARCLVTAAGLDPDKAVLDNVNTTDPMATGESVGCKKYFEATRRRFSGRNQLYRNSLGEHDSEVFRDIWSLGGRYGEFPHIFWGSGVGVFKDTCFIGAMGKVLVHAPGFGFGT